jgi:glycerol dehydrogenase-like iron-containing ADH family enzyme
MPNRNRTKKNQPPTVVGKQQRRQKHAKLEKRSEIVQAARHHAELNLGTSDEEEAARMPPRARPKAGR